jgi:hypothetical protein
MLLFRNYRVKRVLKKARRLIEENGWVQGTFHNSQGYCLVGAVDEAASGFVLNDEAIQELDSNLNDISSPYPRSNIFYWNDKLGRKKREVVSLLDRTIEKL